MISTWPRSTFRLIDAVQVGLIMSEETKAKSWSSRINPKGTKRSSTSRIRQVASRRRTATPIQEAVKELLDEEILNYWSSGSTTYLMLAEYFPKE